MVATCGMLRVTPFARRVLLCASAAAVADACGASVLLWTLRPCRVLLAQSGPAAPDLCGRGRDGTLHHVCNATRTCMCVCDVYVRDRGEWLREGPGDAGAVGRLNID